MRKKILSIALLLFAGLAVAQNSGWTTVNSGTTLNLNSVHWWFEYVFVVGDSGIILKSSDIGQTWQVVQSPTTTNLNGVKIQNNNSILVVGDGGLILLSTDIGNSWQFINSGVSDDLMSVAVEDGAGIIVGKSGTALYSSFGYGEQWEIRPTGLVGAEFSTVYLAAVSNQAYVGGKNSIFQSLIGRTTNSGFNWDFMPFYLNGNEGSVTDVNFLWWSMNTGFATSVLWDGRGGISKSTDSGTNWVTSIFNYPLNAVAIPWKDPLSLGYAVGDSGKILKTYDFGELWYEQKSVTNNRLNDIDVVKWYTDTLITVGDNGTILITTSGGEPVTTLEYDEIKPTHFSLGQNYPNPFNPSTKIKFSIPSVITSGAKQSQLVTLKVYDVLGNEIATLVNKELSPGEYEVKFESNRLPSGIYFYTLRAGSFIQTKKMVLLK